MSSDEVNKVLFNKNTTFERILKFITGPTLEHFLADSLLQSAIERQSEIAWRITIDDVPILAEELHALLKPA